MAAPGTWESAQKLGYTHLLLRRYRMDYLKFVEHHRATNADITIGCLPVDYERASDFGLMKIDDEGRIFVSTWLACELPRICA